MLKAVERSRLSDQVFAQLRDRILSEHYQSGDRLPPERELCDMLKVNRSSVREALKRLEQAKLIEIRQGGGSIVLDFRTSAGFDLLGDLLMPGGQLNLVALRSIFEFRSLIGPEIARLAALRIKKADLDELERLVEEIESCSAEDVGKLQTLDFEFHYTMGRAGENLALLLILNSAREIYFAYRNDFTAIFERMMDVRELYREIYEGLLDHDEERSEKVCARLIEDGNQAFWERYREMGTPEGNPRRSVGGEIDTDAFDSSDS